MQLRCLAELSDISTLYLDLNLDTYLRESRKNCFIIHKEDDVVKFYYITSWRQSIEIPIGNTELFIEKLDHLKHQQSGATLYLNHAQMVDLIPNWANHDPKQRARLTPLTESGETLAQYARLFVSSLLTVLGEHSLYEFTTPLQMAATQQAFKTIPNYEKEMALDSLFYRRIPEPFERALNKTIAYEERLLLRKQTDEVIKKTYSSLIGHQRHAAIRLFDHKHHQEVVAPQLLDAVYAEKSEELIKTLRAARNPFVMLGILPSNVNRLIELIETKNLRDAINCVSGLSNSAGFNSSPFIHGFLKNIKGQLVGLQTIQEKQVKIEPNQGLSF